MDTFNSVFDGKWIPADSEEHPLPKGNMTDDGEDIIILTILDNNTIHVLRDSCYDEKTTELWEECNGEFYYDSKEILFWMPIPESPLIECPICRGMKKFDKLHPRDIEYTRMKRSASKKMDGTAFEWIECEGCNGKGLMPKRQE